MCDRRKSTEISILTNEALMKVLSIVLLFLYLMLSPASFCSGAAQCVAFSMCLISLLFLNRSSAGSSFKNDVGRIVGIKQRRGDNVMMLYTYRSVCCRLETPGLLLLVAKC